MSMSMYMKIPQIVGGSTDEGWVGALDVLAYSWGLSNPGSVVNGPGKPNVQDLSFTSYVDTATSPLCENLLTGLIMKQAVLSVVYPIDSSGSTATDTYTMTSVLVTSAAIGGSTGEDRLTMNWTLNFGALNFLIHGKHLTWNLRTGTTTVAG